MFYRKRTPWDRIAVALGLDKEISYEELMEELIERRYEGARRFAAGYPQPLLGSRYHAAAGQFRTGIEAFIEMLELEPV